MLGYDRSERQMRLDRRAWCCDSGITANLLMSKLGLYPRQLDIRDQSVAAYSDQQDSSVNSKAN